MSLDHELPLTQQGILAKRVSRGNIKEGDSELIFVKKIILLL